MIFQKENHPLSYVMSIMYIVMIIIYIEVNENIPNSNGEFDEKTYLYKNIYIYIYIYIITHSATHAPLPNLRKIM
jgi:hypothetical protein